MSKRKSLSVAVFVFLGLALGGLACAESEAKAIKAKIGDKIYTFEVADTVWERSRGLMLREKIDKDSGMFFVFDRADYVKFHMANTSIPLDIAFIDSDFTILEIRKMQPLNAKPILSGAKVQYALEVNRGFFIKVGLKVGDRIEFLAFTNGDGFHRFKSLL